MKIRSRLLAVSLLLSPFASHFAEAQDSKPRYGYKGTTSAGGSSSTAGSTVKKPASASKTSAKPGTKTVAAKPAAEKSKIVAKAVKPAAKKPAKEIANTKTTKPSAPAKKAPVKETASNSKSSGKKEKTTPAREVAETSRKTKPSSKTQEKEKDSKTSRTAVAKTAPEKTKSSVVKFKETPPEVAVITPSAAVMPPPAVHRNEGFHFFGTPVMVPTFTESSIRAMARTEIPTPKPIDLSTARVAMEEVAKKQSVFHPAVVPVAPAKPISPPPKVSIAKAEPAPKPEAPAAASPKPEPEADVFLMKASPMPATAPAAGYTLNDEPFSRTMNASIKLKGTAQPLGFRDKNDQPEAMDLKEPAPAPPLPKTSVSNQKSTPALGKAGTASKTEEAHDKIAAILEGDDSEANLSERERAFVKSLAAAANRATTGDDKTNESGREIVKSIPTSSTAVARKVPDETVDRFRSVVKNVKERIKDSVPELTDTSVAKLPDGPGTDLMPSTPEKMPKGLPAFDGPESGKIDVQSDRQADYDQANNKVIFTGKVELNSKAIRLRADRVEVYMKKGGGGMDRVEAEGNVLMRTQATENSPGQMASSGRAYYDLRTGEITLTDWPKIQETGKSHVSTSASTKMFLFTDGRIRTDGPNRTLIGN